MPLVLPDLPQAVADRLVEHLVQPAHVRRALPGAVGRARRADVPPRPPASRLPLHLARALSLNTNWFLVHGLRGHGYDDVAARIAERSREAVERGGLNEFYDPLDGSPVGAERFGWATLVADL